MYVLKNNKLEPIEVKPFESAYILQKLVENNLDSLFNYKVVKSGFWAGNYKIGTLCYDEESKFFIIIEYLEMASVESISVIDRYFSCLNAIGENRNDLIFQYEFKLGRTFSEKTEGLNLRKIKIVFVSHSYGPFQLKSINFKDLPIELWEIKGYDKNIYTINQHKPSPGITSITEIAGTDVMDKIEEILPPPPRKRGRPRKEVNGKKKSKPQAFDLFSLYSKEILAMGSDIDLKDNKFYQSFRKNKKIFVYLTILRKSLKILLNIKKGQLNDPKKAFRDVSNVNVLGNGDYEIKLSDTGNMEYILSMIKQSYNILGDSEMNEETS